MFVDWVQPPELNNFTALMTHLCHDLLCSGTSELLGTVFELGVQYAHMAPVPDPTYSRVSMFVAVLHLVAV